MHRLFINSTNLILHYEVKIVSLCIPLKVYHLAISTHMTYLSVQGSLQVACLFVFCGLVVLHDVHKLFVYYTV